MALVFTWELQGTTPTEISNTDFLLFAGMDGFGSPVFADDWQDSTHVETSGGDDKSDGNDPNNVKYISQDGGTGGDSQADWGDGTEDIDQITNAEATLKITLTDDGAFDVVDPIFYAFEYGGDVEDPPAGDLNVKAFEVGNTNFTDIEGQGSALELEASVSPSTSHEYYIGISQMSPIVGTKLATLRLEATIE